MLLVINLFVPSEHFPIILFTISNDVIFYSICHIKDKLTYLTVT